MWKVHSVFHENRRKRSPGPGEEGLSPEGTDPVGSPLCDRQVAVYFRFFLNDQSHGHVDSYDLYVLIKVALLLNLNICTY